MEKKVFVEINKDAWVEEGNKRIVGKYQCSENEADRLVNVLGVAKYINEVPAAVAATKTVTKIPDMSWKKDELINLLKANNITFDETATKEVLIKTFIDWNEAKDAADRV